jgi:hypothetical protein
VNAAIDVVVSSSTIIATILSLNSTPIDEGVIGNVCGGNPLARKNDNLKYVVLYYLQSTRVMYSNTIVKYTEVKREEISMIRLELGGKIFTAARNILMNVKGTYFYSMLSSSWRPNSDGVYVIDQPKEELDRMCVL